MAGAPEGGCGRIDTLLKQRLARRARGRRGAKPSRLANAIAGKTLHTAPG
jgi:hypothetical protein